MESKQEQLTVLTKCIYFLEQIKSKIECGYHIEGAHGLLTECVCILSSVTKDRYEILNIGDTVIHLEEPSLRGTVIENVKEAYSRIKWDDGITSIEHHDLLEKVDQ